MTPRVFFLLWLFALAVRSIYALVNYSPGFTAFESGDYALYRIGAEHLMQDGSFTNSLFLVRPPLYPLWVALMEADPLRILISGIVAGALIAPCGAVFVRLLHPDPRLALGTGFLLAIDPTGIQFSAFLGPEPFANLFLLLALTALLRAMRDGSAAWGAAAGALLMLSAYTRPSTYLFWIPLALWWGIRHRGALFTHWRGIAVFVGVCAAGVAAWTLHNQVVFATPSFSTVAPYTMVYYRAASVERIASGQPIEAVYIALSRRVVDYADLDIDPVDAGTRHQFLAAPPPVQAALNRVALEIFAAHPLITLATFPVGFARMYGLFPDTFTPLSLSLIGVNALLLIGAGMGTIIALRQRRWTLLIAALLPIAYYTAGTLIVKSAGMDTRERSMLEPMLILLWMLAFVAWADRQAARRRKMSPPADSATARPAPPG
ncbi:MAG: hypothetical protein SF162_12730 [bacterium]|nr:hypothetical protein [bacterium]